MSLSNDLISQFVKATRDDKKTSRESTHLGTVVEFEGRTYVQLDGSELLTPVDQTITTQSGERVTVTIKDHSATITGNITSPSVGQNDIFESESVLRAEFDSLTVGTLTVEDLVALNARIDNLEVNEAFINDLTVNDLLVNGKLTAAEAEIEYLKATKIDTDVLEADYAKITDLEAVRITANIVQADLGDFRALYVNDLTAINADIKELKAFNADIENLDAKYADIEFANIGEAAIENFYAKSGIIEKFVSADGHITHELVAVKINGDLIEAGTLKVDRLIVLGTDGQYYELNTDFSGLVGVEPVDEDKIHGSILVAESVTADKVYVTDLVAFDATIGGFHITDHSLYSGVKESADNTTTGVYMDDDGQFVVGDMDNFIKWYKDPENPDGGFILDISLVSESEQSLLGIIETEKADIIATAQGMISTASESYVNVDDFASYKTETESKITQNADNISLNFSTTSQQIGDVNSDVQTKFEELYKYIRFSGETAITIGSGDNSIVLEVDNERGIIFRKNDVALGLWNGSDFYTGNVVVEVEERAQFGNFAFVPRSDGSLSFLRVGSPPMIVVVQPKDLNVGVGQTWSLRFEVKGYNISYQWQYKSDAASSFTNISGATSAKLEKIDAAKSQNGQYRCIATNKHGTQLISNVASVIVGSELKIIAQPHDIIVPAYGTGTLSIEAAGEGLTYQWYYNTTTSGGEPYNWAKVSSGGTDSTLTVTVGAIGPVWRMCVITDAYGSSVTSRHAKIIITSASSDDDDPGDDATLRVVTEPQDISVYKGDTYTLTVEAEGEGLTYQWQSRDILAAGVGWNDILGATTNTLTSVIDSASTSTETYRRCIITDSSGESVASRIVTITILDSDDAGGTSLRIITEPQDMSIPKGSSGVLSIVAEGEGLTYQWYSSGDEVSWSILTGKTADTCTVSIDSGAMTGFTTYRRCIVTDSSGASVTSRTAVITADDSDDSGGSTTLRIVTEPQDTTVVKGEIYTLSVVATGEGLSYQWQFSSNASTWTANTTSTTDTLRIGTAVDSTLTRRYWRCVVTDSSGATVTSRVATVTYLNP